MTFLLKKAGDPFDASQKFCWTLMTHYNKQDILTCVWQGLTGARVLLKSQYGRLEDQKETTQAGDPHLSVGRD